MSDTETIDPHVQVSHEQDGRVLSGVGVSADDLAATMDRHAPKTKSTETPALGTAGAPPVDGQAGSVTPSDPPQTRGRQRFSDLTKERDSAREETAAERTKREAAEARITALETQLAQARTPQQQQDAQQALTQETNRQAAQQPVKFPKFEDFVQIPGYEHTDYDEYLDFRADWRAQQRAAAQPPVTTIVQQALASEQAARTFNETVTRTHAKGRETYKDFDAVRTSGPGSQIPLGPDYASALSRAQFIVNHPASEHLQYAIMKDGDLAQSLQRMSDIDFGLRIAQLAPAPPSTQRQTPPPPAPYQPVGNGGPTAQVASSDLAKKGFDFDKSGYREKRAAERGLKSRAR